MKRAGLVLAVTGFVVGCFAPRAVDAFAPLSNHHHVEVSRHTNPASCRRLPKGALSDYHHLPFLQQQRRQHYHEQRKDSSRLSLQLGGTGEFITQLTQSIFRVQGPVPLVEALGINAVLFAALNAKLFTMLTPSGFINAFGLGTMLWTTLGWRGWIYCVFYLIFGQAVTKVRFEEKESKGLAEGRGGRRGPENVWGSAATGLFCAICAANAITFFGVDTQLFLLGYVASLATKLADTFASEIGKAYGKTTFLITNLERVEPGTEGAVSVEGTAAALAGGLLLSLCGWGLGFISLPAVAVSSVAAFVATNIESLLGATLQGKDGLQWITNEVINFMNTAIGAALAIVMAKLMLGM